MEPEYVADILMYLYSPQYCLLSGHLNYHFRNILCHYNRKNTQLLTCAYLDQLVLNKLKMEKSLKNHTDICKYNSNQERQNRLVIRLLKCIFFNFFFNITTQVWQFVSFLMQCKIWDWWENNICEFVVFVKKFTF